MSTTQPSALLRHLRQLAGEHAAESLTDRELLRRFTAGRDEAAFAVLVRRHGPMVLSVCRRRLHRTQDIEDAFQATFLVLLRKAAKHPWREGIGGWLHGVASRVALRAHAETMRSAAAVARISEEVHADPLEQLTARELFAAFDEELSRLPASYREPLVLCHLQGHSQEETARQLGWSLSTVRRRLERGRKLLHSRMARRGLSLPALAAALLSRQEAAATLRVPALPETFSVRATLLADAVLRAAVHNSLKATAALLVMLGVLAAGAGLAARHMLMTEPPQTVAPNQAEVPKSDKAERTDRYGDPLPPGALVRMGTVRYRDRYFLGNVVYSPDGNLLAAGDSEGGILLYDAGTGRKFRRLEANTNKFPALAFAPDGKTLASAGTGGIQIWDPHAGKELHRLSYNASGAFTYGLDVAIPLAYSGDGKLLASAAPGHSVHIWDVKTGKKVAKLAGHEAPIHCLAFSADGAKLFSATQSQTQAGSVRVWEIGTGKEVRKFSLHRPGVMQHSHPLGFTPDGKSLAFAAFETMQRKEGKFILNLVGEMLTFLDLDSGKERRGRLELQPERFKSVAFSPDGKSIATLNAAQRAVGDTYTLQWADRVKVWDLETGKQLFDFQPHARRYGFAEGGPNLLAFAPDGKSLAAAAGAPALHVWELIPGRKPVETVEAHHDIICGVAFSPDGRSVATASSDHTLAVWDAVTGQQRIRQRGQEGTIVSVAFSPDGKRLASASSSPEQSVRLWEAATGKELHRNVVPMAPIEGTQRVPVTTWVTFAADGKFLASGGTDRKVRLWDVATGKEIRNQTIPGLRTAPNATPRDLFQYPGGIRDIAFTPNGRTMALCAGNKIVGIVDVVVGQLLFQFDTETAVSVVALSPDGKTFLCGSGKSFRLVETASGADLHKANLDDEVFAAAFAPDGRTAAVSSGSLHGTIDLFDVPTGKELLRLRGHESRVRSLAFSPDGTKLASGQWDSTALVWDVSAARRKLAARDFTPRDLDRLWDDLKSADARKAHAALWALAAAQERAVPLLKNRLHQVPRVAADRLRRLVADLDAEDFARREEASRELAKLGTEVEPALRRALEAKPSLEMRRRVEALLANLICQTEVTPDALRQLRAIQVLEQIGSPEARRVLGTLTHGAPAAPATRDATAALARLACRAASP